MKKFIPLLLFLGFGVFRAAQAQEEIPLHIKEEITYPVFDFHPFVGVMPVEDPALTYDGSLDYKVAVDLYGRIKDSTAVQNPFLETARTYNLGIANGIPPEKLQLAGVIHGGLVNAILSDEEYQKKYGIPNPNLPVLQQLVDHGVKFYVCGQSMGFLNVSLDQISPLVKQAMSAKYSFITLDQMGYSFLDISGD